MLTKELFLSYLEEEITEERPFYMHTDMESTDKVKEQLKCADDACALFFPDPDDEEALLRMLGDEDATYSFSSTPTPLRPKEEQERSSSHPG